MSKVAASRRQVAQAPLTLPRQLTTFVGRDAELRSLKQAVRASRLVTLTGTGGAGKTRLAIEVARVSSALWPDGVWWVPLEAADDAPGAVLAALDLRGAGHAADVIASWLSTKRALLILDNSEHLVAACAQLCHTLLERCPNLSILATSREPLGVAGEARWPVTALIDPDALQLFEARAQLVSPEFRLSVQNRDPVTAICRRLDSLPLAIEMAAARLDLMSERELLANLNNRFLVLESSARTVPQRQRTMAAAIDWSHRLMTDEEQRLFRRLAVFQAGFTLDAAQAVCADPRENVLAVLSTLIQKSMVVAEKLSDGGTRYRLLESHRDFAGERLQESGELNDVQRRHYDYFRSRKWAPVESADFWQAAAWARDKVDDGGLALALEIGNSDFSQQTRAQKLILDLLEKPAASVPLRTRATIMASRLAWRQGDLKGSLALTDSAIAMARALGDTELHARALNAAGLIHETSGEPARAGELYDEAISQLSDPAYRALAIDFSNGRALLAIVQGEPARAVEILTECVAFARRQDDPGLLGRYLESLAQAQLDLHDDDGAADAWTEALAIFRDLDDWFGIIWCLVGLALVAAARNEDERTLRLAAAADRLSREYSLASWSYRAKQVDDVCKRARTRLGSKTRGQAAWHDGATMTTNDAVDYALSGTRPVEEAVTTAGPLSRRELEVATMVASGMTNREIAQRLFIAERTAEGHVERIRNKLGVRSRTEVATWAVEHGLGRKALDKPPAGSNV